MKSRSGAKINKPLVEKVSPVIQQKPANITKMVSRSVRTNPVTTINVTVPDKDKLDLAYSEGLTQTKPFELVGQEFQTEIRTLSPGIQTLKATYRDSDDLTSHVYVKNLAANTISVVPNELTIEVNQFQTITLNFDKEFPDDQQPPKIITNSDHIAVIEEFTSRRASSDGTFKVCGLSVGSGVIDCYVAGVNTPIYYNVVESKGVSSAHQIIKDDLSKNDLELIDEYLTENNITPKDNDILIVKVIEDTILFAIRTYLYLNNKWTLTNGFAKTDNIIFNEDIILAGNYSQIGNIVKKQDGQLLEVKGLSVLEFIKKIFTQQINPSIIKLPTISNFDHNQDTLVEFGTELTNIEYGQLATLSQGEYSFNQKSNVSLLDVQITRQTNSGTDVIGNELSGSDSIMIDEETGYVKYIVNAQYSDDDTVLLDNLGNIITEDLNIKSGNINVESKSILGYRKILFGGLDTTDITSETIKNNLDSIPNINIPSTINLSAKPATRHVIITFPQNTLVIEKIVNNTVMGTDVTDTFRKITLDIPGNNGYKPIPYDVYVYTPANPFKYDTEFEITFGGDTNE